MSGVVDKHGVQWERCSCCGNWTRFDALGYEPPSAEHPFGRDMCIACTNESPNVNEIEPAPTWVPQYEGDAA